MKALVKARREPGLWLDDVPMPEPGDWERHLRSRRGLRSRTSGCC